MNIKFAVYFINIHHPCVDVSIYKKLFKIFARNLKSFGHDFIHLTDNDDEAKSDYVFRHPIENKDHVMFNREVIWLEYLKTADKNSVHCLLEPDSIMFKHIPDLDGDLVLLSRPRDIISPGFRMCKTTAIPFYEEVLRNYPENGKDWHGDVIALEKTIKPKFKGIPNLTWNNLKIDIRDYKLYCGRPTSFSYLANFKGHSKPMMLKYDHD